MITYKNCHFFSAGLYQCSSTVLKQMINFGKGLYFKLLLRSTLILVQGKGLSIKLALPMSDVSAIIK